MSVGFAWEGVSYLEGDWSEEAIKLLQAAKKYLFGWDEDTGDCIPEVLGPNHFSGGGSRTNFSDRLFLSFDCSTPYESPLEQMPCEEREFFDGEVHEALLTELIDKELSILIHVWETCDAGGDGERRVFVITGEQLTSTYRYLSVSMYPEEACSWSISLCGRWSEQAIAGLNAAGAWWWRADSFKDFDDSYDIVEKWAFSKENMTICPEVCRPSFMELFERAAAKVSEAEGFDGAVYQALLKEMAEQELSVVFECEYLDETYEPFQETWTLTCDGTGLHVDSEFQYPYCEQEEEDCEQEEE